MNKENLDEQKVKATSTTAKDENADKSDNIPENAKDELNEEAEDTTADNEETSGESEPSDSEDIDNELQQLKDELAESKDKYLRLYSEFENYRRRTAKEKLEMVQTASEDLMVALLPVLDDFERAEKSFADENTDLKAVKEGVLLVYNKFKKALEQKGLTAMEGKEGMDFDADYHEAITQIPAPKKNLKGKVVDVIEKGYLLKDKVIRYAKVVIGN